MKTLYNYALLSFMILTAANANGQCNYGNVTGTSGSANYIGSGGHRNILCPGDSVLDLANTGGNAAYLDSGSYYLLNGPGGGNTFYVKRHATLDISGSGTGNIIRYDTGAIIHNALTSVATLQSCNNLQFNAQPTLNAITGPSTVCIGSTIALANSTTGGSWSASNSTASVNSGGNVTGVAAGTDTITYTVTTSCGSFFVTRIITIQALNPVITGLDSVCVGCSITLSISSTSGIWNSAAPTASITSSSTASSVILGVSAGTDTIRYSGSNACGSYTAIKIITITAKPHTAPITGASTVCVGSSLQLSEAVSGGVWKSSNHNAFVSGGLVAGIAPGIDTIMYVITNGSGADTALKIIAVLPIATVSAITGANTVCLGCSITLIDTTTGGVWAASNGNATVTGGVVTGITGGKDTITYSVSSSCNTAVSSLVVTVQAPLNLGVLRGPDYVCVGGVSLLMDTATGLPATGKTWSASNGHATVTRISVGLGETGRVAGVSAGTDTISFTVNTGSGLLTVSKVITVGPLPAVLIITGSTLSTTNTYASYQWQKDTIAIPGANGATYTMTAAGSYRVVVTDANGCVATSNSVSYVGITSVNNPSEIRIFPNPAQNVVYIDSKTKVLAQLTGIDGRILMAPDNSTKIDVHAFPAGTYLLNIFDAANGIRLKTERIIINR